MLKTVCTMYFFAGFSERGTRHAIIRPEGCGHVFTLCGIIASAPVLTYYQSNIICDHCKQFITNLEVDGVYQV